MIRQKTTEDDKARFRKILIQELRARSMKPEEIIDEATDYELCAMYEKLTSSQKRGIWPTVDVGMGKPVTWAAKHYQNSFKKVLYSGQLTTELKEWIQQQLSRFDLLGNTDWRAVVKDIQHTLAERHIFPSAIKSFALQELDRMRIKTQLSLSQARMQRSEEVISKVVQVKPNFQNAESQAVTEETLSYAETESSVKTVSQQTGDQFYNALVSVNAQSQQQDMWGKLNSTEQQEYARFLAEDNFPGVFQVLCARLFDSAFI